MPQDGVPPWKEPGTTVWGTSLEGTWNHRMGYLPGRNLEPQDGVPPWNHKMGYLPGTTRWDISLEGTWNHRMGYLPGRNLEPQDGIPSWKEPGTRGWGTPLEPQDGVPLWTDIYLSHPSDADCKDVTDSICSSRRFCFLGSWSCTVLNFSRVRNICNLFRRRQNQKRTRQSSCVNARGIPPAAWHAHSMLFRGGGGGYLPWWGGTYPRQGGTYPRQGRYLPWWGSTYLGTPSPPTWPR